MKKILYLGRDGGVLFTDLPTAFNIVIRNRQSGNTGRLNRNLYVMLKFTERPKTPGMTSKKHCLP